MSEVINILLADDDPNFVLLLRTAFEYADVNARVFAVSDGLQIIAYLKREHPFADWRKSPRPHILVLDLRLPGMGGLEVLRWVRTRSEFAQLPVIMLTGSETGEEIEKARMEGASEFLIKPFDFAELTSTAEHIAQAAVAKPQMEYR